MPPSSAQLCPIAHVVPSKNAKTLCNGSSNVQYTQLQLQDGPTLLTHVDMVAFLPGIIKINNII